ncbi:MAG TPA: thioesterase family protein [Bryobacteraceae bacterium]|nr:thioesterase family protein [Bryobacteraceae bacterium]
MLTIEAKLRVRYAETDQMGIVYYANYFVWMEVGRVEYCRAVGISYREVEQNDGILLAVAEANCRYSAPARYDEEVLLATSVAHARPRMMQFDYVMRSAEDGRLLARGFTKHIFLGKDLRPVKMPDVYLRRLQPSE